MKYVIDSAKINDVIDAYNRMNVDIYYPTKVNFNQKLIRLLDSKIKGYEVDSIFHIEELISRFNVDPHRLLYSYPLKREEEIRRALDLGVRMFVVDSIDDYEIFVRSFSAYNISIIARISIDNIVENEDDCFFKWGIPLEKMQLLKASFQLSPLCLFSGISFYLPQEVSNINNFRRVLFSLQKKINLSEFDYLDIGGGIDADTLETILPEINQVVDFKRTKIIVEPGRPLVGSFIDMIAEIIAIRIYGETHVAYLDTGIYNGLLDIIIKGRHFEIVAEKVECSESFEFIVCGKSSDVSDVIGRYKLPSNLKKGDKVRISCCGAYCSEMETNFFKGKTDYELV